MAIVKNSGMLRFMSAVFSPTHCLRPLRPSAAAFLALMAFSAAAGAEPARSTWASFLYAGPGSTYAVIDEVPQASTFDVSLCSDGWCRVMIGGVEGYLRSEIVRRESQTDTTGLLPNPALRGAETPKGSCFDAVQTGGNGGHLPITICPR